MSPFDLSQRHSLKTLIGSLFPDAGYGHLVTSTFMTK